MGQSDVRLIVRDSAYWKWRPIGELKDRFGDGIYDGTMFPRGSYRGDYSSEHKDSSGRTVFWFDAAADDWGWCVYVRNQKIEGFGYLKG